MNRSLWLFIALFFPLLGCSTKVTSDTLNIKISTNPPEANLTVCNERTEQCLPTVKTPYTMIIKRSQDLSWPSHYTISCNKKGFAEVARTLHIGVNGWYLLIVNRETSEMLEVWEGNEHNIELELPSAESISGPSEEVLAQQNISW